MVSIKKRSIGLSFFRATAGRARVIRVRWLRGQWIKGCAGMGLELMTGGKFKMILDYTEIKMGVADEGEFSLGLYALVSV